MKIWTALSSEAQLSKCSRQTISSLHVTAIECALQSKAGSCVSLLISWLTVPAVTSASSLREIAVLMHFFPPPPPSPPPSSSHTEARIGLNIIHYKLGKLLFNVITMLDSLWHERLSFFFKPLWVCQWVCG